ncbi:hypothetical protein [Flavobacterium sp.]|uniref:hypothetical protein n=1 Tax=Flavobacterium sp. TaxID=239 RepID=UPI0040477612
MEKIKYTELSNDELLNISGGGPTSSTGFFWDLAFYVSAGVKIFLTTSGDGVTNVSPNGIRH